MKNLRRFLLGFGFFCLLNLNAKETGTDFKGLVDKIAVNLREAQKLSEANQKGEASGLVSDTYFDLFEGGGLEKAIAIRSASVKSDLENQFNGLRAGYAAGALSSEMASKSNNLVNQISVATFQLTGDGTWWEKFLSAALILLREGFEAILIIGAIAAFLIKTNNRALLRIVRSATLSAVAVSAVLAAVFQLVFRITAAQQELMEGLTMIFACGVLFMVGHWLIAQAESQHWMKYVKEQVSGAISTKSQKALWFTCFLAVFREGAETVLFYQALWSSSAPALHSSIVAGLAVGSLGLGIIYFTFQKGVLKIPMKPFFRVTSALLYLLAFTISGQAVTEFQAGGLLRVNPLEDWSAVPFLGFYPTLEHVVVQGILVASLLFSVLWVWFSTHKKNVPYVSETVLERN